MIFDTSDTVFYITKDKRGEMFKIPIEEYIISVIWVDVVILLNY